MGTNFILLTSEHNYQDSPHHIVFWSFILLTIASFIYFQLKPWSKNMWKNIRGEFDKNGMRRQFVYNKQPYIMVMYVALTIVLSGCIAALALFALGGTGFLLLWLLKVIVWCIIIIGWICAIVGALGLFAGGAGIIPLIIGIIILVFEEEMANFGELCVNTGLEFYNTLNIWEYCLYLFDNYGIIFGITALAPIIIGIVIILGATLCSLIFWIVETLMTRRYNIKHPCPFCHNPSEPAIYLSDNQELPVKLRPGVYGLFHITHPVTGEKMPTMLLNGRDNLPRRCPHCGHTISYKTGVEKHLAFVGLPESGKTCLTYRFVGNLMRNYPDIRFTDEVNNEAQRIITDIKDGKEQELASKTSVADMRRSLQILAQGNGSMPYHIFINDVGGELFTTSGIEATYVQFFKDVESVSIIIDPFTMDFSEYELGNDFATWYNKNVASQDAGARKEKVSNVINTIKTMSDQFMHKTKKMHMNIILVKIDSGYVPNDIVGDEARIKDFVTNQMNLIAEVADLESTYASLHFYAVSALKNIGIEELISGISEELKIKLS